MADVLRLARSTGPSIERQVAVINCRWPDVTHDELERVARIVIDQLKADTDRLVSEAVRLGAETALALVPVAGRA